MSNEMSRAGREDLRAEALLDRLRDLIQSARQKAVRAVDAVQVQTCWEIGRHIVDFEQGGSSRAVYVAALLQTLARDLSKDFGRGFDASNLRHMRFFYQAFPIRDALRHELSWTHYRTLLRVEDESARDWYMLVTHCVTKTKQPAGGGARARWSGRSTRCLANGY
jgi:hypothetical protein